TEVGPLRRGQAARVTATGTQELSDVLVCSFDWDSSGPKAVAREAASDAGSSDLATGSYVVGVRVVDGDGGVATGTTTVVVQPQTLGGASWREGAEGRGRAAAVTATGAQEGSRVLGYWVDWANNGT